MKTKRFSRVLATTLALIMVLGMLPLGAAAADSAEVVQWNVTLADDICPNFYVSLPDADKSTVTLSVGNGTAVSYTPDQLTQSDDGYYIVRANLAAAQMTDEIKLSIIVDGVEAVSNTYTVAQYAASILKDSSLSHYHELVKNMLNYGAKAQLYFDHNSDNLANAGYALDSEATVPAEEEMVIDGSVAGLSFYGTSLLFQNKIVMRYYFTAPNGVDGYTFTVNDTGYEAIAKDGKYYIQIDGINPQDYSVPVTLCVSDGSTSLNVTYSPMCYITRMCNKETTSAALKALLSAMYGYHYAACNLVIPEPASPTPEELGYTRITLAGLGVVDGTQGGNLSNNKLVEDGLDMKYLDADVSFGTTYDASSGVKYGASAAGSWDGFKIGLASDGSLEVRYTTTNLLLYSVTAEEAGVESFNQTFNLKFASKVSASETAGRLNFIISMWINDQLLLDHLLVGNLTGMGHYVGILTWNGASVTVFSQQTPEEMGYTRYTMADLGVADGTYADNAVRSGIPAAGVSNGYLDVDVAFSYLPTGAADGSTGIKLAHTGPASWDGFRIALADGDKLTVRYASSNYEIFSITTDEAKVDTFTETFNLKVALKLEDLATGGKLATISLWINDRVIKKNHSEGFNAAGIGEYAGILTWFGAGITVATPAIEEEPDVTEPEVTEPEVTEPEVTEPEVTEPAADPTPEELGYTRFTLAGLGIADGTYNTNAVTCAERAGGLNNTYLDVDVSFSGTADGSSGIKIANTGATSWNGIRIGLADGDKLTVRYTVSNLELKTFAPADVGLNSFSETFNLKVAVKIVDSATEGCKDVTLSVWINDKLVINHMLIGGVSGIGNCAGILSWGGASITVASQATAEELGYTRLTMKDLGYADGTYDGNAVRTAEVADGLNGRYLDVDVAFGSTVDGSSGIKIGNTAATSWNGIRIGLTSDGSLIVQAMAANQTIFTLTAEEAGVASFTETFNLKVSIDMVAVNESFTNVTMNLWINDQLIKKNVSTGGISGIGNFAGMLTWSGASITVATPA